MKAKQPPPPDPKLIAAQGDAQREQVEAGTDRIRAQNETVEMTYRQQEAASRVELQRANAIAALAKAGITGQGDQFGVMVKLIDALLGSGQSAQDHAEAMHQSDQQHQQALQQAQQAHEHALAQNQQQAALAPPPNGAANG